MMDHAHRATATPARNVRTTTNISRLGNEVGAKHDTDMRPKLESY